MIALFGGTTESWKIAKYLQDMAFDFILFTATDFSNGPNDVKERIKRHAKPLNLEEIQQAFVKYQVKLVIDATHPYAVQVSSNLMVVCQALSLNYCRYERSSVITAASPYISRFPDYDQAICYLQTTSGNILLSTGSNSLGLFTEKIDLDRLYVRVLPIPKIIQKTIDTGIKSNHILAMQGPFSEEMNSATLLHWNIDYLVSKDSGLEGGIEEKVRSVEKMKNKLIIIDKPKICYAKIYDNLHELYKEINQKMEAIKNAE